jgi:hypothetical protein
MSDTPRTDSVVAALAAISPTLGTYGATEALADYARDLERELAEAKRDAKQRAFCASCLTVMEAAVDAVSGTPPTEVEAKSTTHPRSALPEEPK